MARGFDAGNLAEDEQFRQRVGTQPVGAVDADAGAFAGGKKPGQWCRAAAVDEDATHRVVHRRAHRDRRMRRVDTHELFCQFVDLWQPFAQLLLAEVAQVEVYHRAVRPLDRAALLLLVPERLAQSVARSEFHRLVAWRRLGRPQPIVLQIAITVLVDQEATFTAAGLGEQQAGSRHAGRMVLDELHVAQRYAVPIGQRHAVAGDDASIGILAEHPAGTTGGNHHRARLDQREFAGSDLDRDDPLDTPVLNDQVNAEMFVQTLDRGILDRGLEQRMQHVKPGLVGREPRPLDLHAAERTHVHVPVRRPAPRATPVLELRQLLGAMGNEVLHHILLAEPVTAMHGIVEVVLEAVARLLHPRRTSFGSDGVTAHRIDLRHQRNPQRGVCLGNGDRRPQACPSATHDHHISLVYLHA
ncbi:MAG: hypothetical protein FAZ92_03574 [Accumulibacter sp.]|nr:MAG: hypothetical protein FAZ92_03574 [Accumulibacter sp.]